MFACALPRRAALIRLLLTSAWLLAASVVQVADPSASQRAAF